MKNIVRAITPSTTFGGPPPPLRGGGTSASANRISILPRSRGRGTMRSMAEGARS